ncbi:Predicted ATPase [Pilibacter termitis]|uniref:Predicted ATPase n=1 Tax=Pilibacter termitis TaxID=263852 RepID=A0A1T4L0E5_9ENTE|nr:AAA family ATPase [Pilibacter termitis]SJZ48071.1 Predicted ATPase [Pilibacter termitis]
MYFGHIQKISIDDLPENEYFSSIPALKNLHSLSFDCPITFFMGENGSGKSTLLEAIAVKSGMNAEGGGRNFNFQTRQTHSSLADFLTIQWNFLQPQDTFFLRAESFYNMASYLETIYGGESERYAHQYGGNLHKMSHGESFFSLMNHRFREGGLYLLDEPEAALSPQNQLAMMSEMNRLINTKAQFIIATHSPILASMPNSTIYSFEEENVRAVNLKETSAYQITEMMINRADGVLRNLFE